MSTSVELQREQRAVEQREMDEAHRAAEDQHVDRDVPPAAARSRRSRGPQPGRAAAHEDGDQQEEPE